MSNRDVAMLALGLALWYAATRQSAGTAGDDDSNALEDGVDEVNNLVTGWPVGAAPYKNMIQQAADDYDVPASILAWLLWKESRYTPAIVSGAKRSPVGAMGIAQFMPATAREQLGSEAAALDPAQAIPGAARYLARLYDSVDTWAEALAAYNWGIGNVQRKGIGAAPAETRNYYTDILAKANATGSTYA